MIKKAVITAGGLGTRFLPFTKEFPREMLPLFCRDKEKIIVKPLLQISFEALFSIGIRNFCFVVGRGKRSIEDYFTPDKKHLEYLKTKNIVASRQLEKFYEKLEESEITWKQQPAPIGFGDAVYRAKSFVGSDDFIVWAGDDYIHSPNNDFIRNLISTFEENNAKAVLSAERVPNPERFGVIFGKEITKGLYKVSKIVEKPKNPESNLTAVAIYVFSPEIFNSIEKIPFGVNNEKQLTDAIQGLIDQNYNVFAEELNVNAIRIDVGKPESYKLALERSHVLLKG
ncbi:MAG: sugar phosphate nucleotidyltransferase [Candidatus Aenigmatarchaeota archaeon]